MAAILPQHTTKSKRKIKKIFLFSRVRHFLKVLY
nr:MAG TPA: hypothetical protein [Caudoviricetes sp.]